MVSVANFYSPARITLGFGKYGSAYTIVPLRHIGADFGRWGGGITDVPALKAGEVVRVVRTGTMAWVVVVRADEDGLYYSYCHLANDNLVKEGWRVEQGQRVGRLARGSAYGAADFPGTAWDGIHLHLVVGTHPESAYSKVPGHRTLTAFRDPDPIVRDVLAAPAGGGSRPFNPGGFLMALSDFQQQQVYDALVKQSESGPYYATDATINVIRGEIATAIASIAAGGIMFPGAPYLAFPAIANAIYAEDGAATVEVDEAELAHRLAPALAPLIAENAGTLSDSTIDSLIAKLLDEQARRLQG